MSFRVSGKNIEIGGALQDHARTKVGAIIGKFFDSEPSGHVTIEPEGSGFRADMFIQLSNGVTLQAEGRAHDAYACFDQAADRIEKRLRRHKQRLKTRHSVPPNGNWDEPQPAKVMASYVIEAPDQEEIPADFSPVVVAESKASLRSMSVSSAVLELDMSGAQLLVFRHAGTTEVNVVYKRPDGHIGWIDPSGKADGTGKRS